MPYQELKIFKVLSVNGFDNFGNYSFGIKEHIIFPEINFDKVDRIRGMDITIVTSGKVIKNQHFIALLKAMNFPFIKEQKIKRKLIEELWLKLALYKEI